VFKPLLSLAVLLAIATAAALPELAPATASSLQPQTLVRAGEIRALVTTRYRFAPGRRLAVTEATSTAVVGSLTLVTESAEFRVVPAENGIYFAICPARASCPYPARSASRPPNAFLPRRQALELAVRTFLETSASLVVVALPTAQPVWVVFERDDLLATVDAQAVLAKLIPHTAVIDTTLRELVDRLTRPRLFVPLPVFPLPRDTILAASLSLG
jgi:hypothetical protein